MRVSGVLARIRKRTFLRTFGGQVAVTMAANVVIALIGLITGSLLARILGPQGRGELAAIQTWAFFFALVASLGLPDAIVYFTGRDPGSALPILVSAMAAMLLASIPIGLIGTMAMPVLLSAQTDSVIALARPFLVAYLFLAATQGMLVHPLRGRNDLLAWNTLRVASPVLWLVALVVAGWLGWVTIEQIAVCLLASFVASGVIAAIVVRRRIPGSFRFDAARMPEMMRLGIPSAFRAFPFVLNLRLDQMLMAALVSPVLLGHYAVAVAWSGAASPVLGSIGGVLFPRVASLQSATDRADLIGMGARLVVLLGLALTPSLMAVTTAAIPLIFGASFAPATNAALILLVAGFISSVNHTLEEGLLGLGQTRLVLIGETGGLVATIAALVLLLPPLQIVGAALASVLGYGATSVILLWLLRRETERPANFFVLPRFSDMALIRRRVVEALR